MGYICHKLRFYFLRFLCFLFCLDDFSAQIFLFHSIIRHAHIHARMGFASYDPGFHRETGEIFTVSPQVLHLVPYRALLHKAPFLQSEFIGKNIADIASAQITVIFQLFFRRVVGIGNLSRPVKYQNHFQRVFYRK